MTTLQAIKAFFTEPPISNTELVEFARGVAPTEREAFGKAICALLGVTWEPTK